MKMPIVISLQKNDFFDGKKREKKRAEKASDKRIFFCSFSFWGYFLMAGAKMAKPLKNFGINVTKKYFI